MDRIGGIMCGRYYVDDETSKEIRKILEQIDAKFQENKRKRGEIAPTNYAPVLIESKGNIKPDLFAWGFPGFQNKGVIINARAETAFQKKMFQESLLSRRCIIPANGFYEWDSSKNKIYFTMKNPEPIYMAGIYNTFEGDNRFVILTTEANQSMIDVHNRMPLILEKNMIEPWIMENAMTDEILHMQPPMLDREAEYMQSRLELF